MRSALMIQPGLPRKVLRKAHELGVHADCMVAGTGGACDPCFKAVLQAMDFFYSDVAKDYVAEAVEADLRADREADLAD